MQQCFLIDIDFWVLNNTKWEIYIHEIIYLTLVLWFPKYGVWLNLIFTFWRVLGLGERCSSRGFTENSKILKVFYGRKRFGNPQPSIMQMHFIAILYYILEPHMFRLWLPWTQSLDLPATWLSPYWLLWSEEWPQHNTP